MEEENDFVRVKKGFGLAVVGAVLFLTTVKYGGIGETPSEALFRGFGGG